MKYVLPKLPYDYSSLEPYINAQTMEVHYTKHHQAYVDKLNEVLLDLPPDWRDKKLEELLASLQWIPEKFRERVKNNAGGHYNHSMFWEMMKPQGGGDPDGGLARQIETDFGSAESFRGKFSEMALKIFGSGWVWLTANSKGKLKLIATPNQDNPLMRESDDQEPILGLDVWEHAYYLQYQNRRVEYIKNWWTVVNWENVAKRYMRKIAHSGL
jgi:Fe-Mn family superoxide dismutase